jgi:RNA ligase
MNTEKMSADITYLSEIIYPENRVVVSYAETDALCLLGGFNRETGEEYDLDELGRSIDATWVPPQYSFDSLDAAMSWAKGLPGTMEGIVLRYVDTNERVKCKSDDYCRLHRMISRITPLGVYDVIVSGDDLEDVRRGIPEEFIEEFDRIHSLIISQVDERVSGVIECANRYAHHTDKELGLAISQKNLIDPVNDPASIGFVFTYRKKGVAEVRNSVLKAIRPTNNILRGFDGTKIAMNKRTSAND